MGSYCGGTSRNLTNYPMFLWQPGKYRRARAHSEVPCPHIVDDIKKTHVF